MKLTGLREVERQLMRLGSAEGTRALRTGMMRAARPITERAAANLARIERGSGALHHAMTQRFVVGHRNSPHADLPPMGGRFTVQITPRRSDRVAIALYNLFYRRRIRALVYGHLLERGYTTRRGTRVPARPFLRPALDAEGPRAVSRLADELRAAINRILRRRR